MRDKHRLKKAGVWMMTAALFAGLLVSPSVHQGTSLPAMAEPATGKKPVPQGAIYKVNTEKKIVALTFDISWGEKAPGPILDILEQKGVKKATFFLSGPWTTTHPEIAKRIKTMGYEIGNHGNKHDDFPKHPNEWIQEQVGKSEQSIFDTTGVKTTLIRTPNGAFDKRVIQKLNTMGYTVIQWNTDSRDWMRPGPDKIVDRVVSKAIPGDIILMHASDSALQTIDALPRIIDGLRAKGYEFLTVSELLSNANVTSKAE
ncbi:polysaccharide deacetylase family sporulation protein PdaB [Tumebacillus sp. ITR2]|uniref:Polysaccharide deacetylase family sporulation protein PdaB n=1 Tax=Tumebacillus amylolyticus TaxID=2801339 RepID=A0ABS1JGL7_9BACL|nr:polysaccharide deacetylase family sporulation protein PdaB [Tumebacillus amylolyticus]MBL0389370.1 polysaccharide deacetylase family sporulation protein PdaB [Tumebacillus amylolyticus]